MTHQILKPTFVRQDARGVFREVLNTGSWESVLLGDASSGAVLGNHYHQETLVFFFLISGSAKVFTEHTETKTRDEFALGILEGVMLQTMESHAIVFQEPSQYVMLKSKQYDPEAPDTYPYSVF